jgi:hypothetical protein
MRAFLSMAARALKVRQYLPWSDSPPSSRGTAGQGRSPQRRRERAHVRLEIERLEDRLTPSGLYVHEPNGQYTPLSRTDINAAFAAILRVSGRQSVVMTQVRRDINDTTVNGSIIDAEFTPTGLFTYVDIVAASNGGSIHAQVLVPAGVEDFAHHFGFDHLNWQQTVTLPATWSARYSVAGVPFGPTFSTFTDPQPTDVLITAERGDPATRGYWVDAKGDSSGLYYKGNVWNYAFVNPLPLDAKPNPRLGQLNPRLDTDGSWFTFEDSPRVPDDMYGSDDADTLDFFGNSNTQSLALGLR